MQLGHLFEIMKTGRKWPIPVLLIKAGFYEIAIGSIIGVLGGWILYNERLHFMVTKQIRKTKVLSKKNGGADKDHQLLPFDKKQAVCWFSFPRATHLHKKLFIVTVHSLVWET